MGQKTDVLFAQQLNEGLVNECNRLQALLDAADKVCEAAEQVKGLIQYNRLTVGGKLWEPLAAYQALKEK